MRAKVQADARSPNHEAYSSLEKFAANLRRLEQFTDELQKLKDFVLGELDGVVIEVDLPAAPLDAGFALGLFPADGCVDHLHEDHHEGESLAGLGSPEGC